MKTSKISSPNLFTKPVNNAGASASPASPASPEGQSNVDNELLERLLVMGKITFKNHLATHPDDLRFALSCEQLLAKIDTLVLKGLIASNAKTCEILRESGKFNEEPYRSMIEGIEGYHIDSRTFPGASRR